MSLPCKNLAELENQTVDINLFKSRFLSKYPEFINPHHNMTQDSKEKFYRTAKDFITQAFFETRTRVPFQEPILNCCEVLTLKDIRPDDIQHWHSFERKWQEIYNNFKNQIVSKNFSHLSDELMSFRFKYNELKSLQGSISDVITFWEIQKKDYPIMTEISIIALTLPYSTAEIERSFSLLRDIRQPKRSKLSVELIEASFFLHKNLGNMENFQITPEIIEKYLQIWETKIISKTENKHESIHKSLEEQKQDEEYFKREHTMETLEESNNIKDDHTMEIIANKEELSQDYMYNGVKQKRVVIQPLDREQNKTPLKRLKTLADLSK